MIAAIVVLFNPTQEELLHISNYCGEVDKTIILDNSEEEHLSSIKDLLDSDFIYKSFGCNVGLCKALNEGMKIAKDYGCQWALLMDSDSSFITNVVEIYKAYICKSLIKNVAVISPIHVFDRSIKKAFEDVRNVKWAMTSGCFYHIGKFFEVGGFKEELFVDGLDIDYCYRARRNGYEILETAEAKLKHYPGQSASVCLFGKNIKYGVASPIRYYMQARAIVWLILQYHQIEDIIRYLYKWIKVLLLFEKKSEYIHQMIRGSKEGFFLWKDEKRTGN